MDGWVVDSIMGWEGWALAQSIHARAALLSDDGGGWCQQAISEPEQRHLGDIRRSQSGMASLLFGWHRSISTILLSGTASASMYTGFSSRDELLGRVAKESRDDDGA